MIKTLQNNESRECPICFNETNGLKMDFHTYMRYDILWRNNLKILEEPLIKCIKCNSYTC